MTAATPGRDELREQIAAALSDVLPLPDDQADVVESGVLSVVDTWVAAHTAEVAGDEQVAAVLDAAWSMVVEQQHHRAPGWSMAKSWAWDNLRAALDALPLELRLTFNEDAALDPPTEGQT